MGQNLVLNFIIMEIIHCIYTITIISYPNFTYNIGGKWAISIEIKVDIAKF